MEYLRERLGVHVDRIALGAKAADGFVDVARRAAQHATNLVLTMAARMEKEESRLEEGKPASSSQSGAVPAPSTRHFWQPRPEPAPRRSLAARFYNRLADPSSSEGDSDGEVHLNGHVDEALD
jgi:hypothetical protein